MTVVDVGHLDDFPAGRIRGVTAGGREIVVVRTTDDRVYAALDRCPHRGAPLRCGAFGGTWAPSAPGELERGLEERILRCPWHGWEFDAESGEAVFGISGRRLRTFPVTVVDGRVQVAVP